MFQTGEMIFYGTQGVCQVKAVGEMDGMGERGQLYYTLKPVYSSETIFIPTDTSVFMRPVMTKTQAKALVQAMPEVEATVCEDRSPAQLSAHYQQAFTSHKTEDLVALIKAVYLKRQQAADRGRRAGQTDQRFMDRAETLLYGELAVALGITRDEVADYINETLSQ